MCIHLTFTHFILFLFRMPKRRNGKNFLEKTNKKRSVLCAAMFLALPSPVFLVTHSGHLYHNISLC